MTVTEKSKYNVLFSSNKLWVRHAFTVFTGLFAHGLEGEGGEGVLCKSWDRDVSVGNQNPYPILDHDQLDFRNLF